LGVIYNPMIWKTLADRRRGLRLGLVPSNSTRGSFAHLKVRSALRGPEAGGRGSREGGGEGGNIRGPMAMWIFLTTTRGKSIYPLGSPPSLEANDADLKAEMEEKEMSRDD